ncbi:MAG: hypothetical protein IKK57_00615 [Clostridia bacterium]|nr:hypothetical protein [Clostridia bacterium]
MDMLKVCGAAVCAAVLALVLRSVRREVSIAAALAAGTLISVLILPRLQEVVQGITAISRAGGLSDTYLLQLLRVCGVSLLMDFAAQTCRDAGENGLAMKVELAGRVTLIALSLPFMQALLTQILSLSS